MSHATCDARVPLISLCMDDLHIVLSSSTKEWTYVVTNIL